MNIEEITIRVDPEAAQAYHAADDEDRRRLDLLLSPRLHEATCGDTPLKELMSKIGRKARQRGLTPEILEAILNERKAASRLHP
jgi:hypothetical protein